MDGAVYDKALDLSPIVSPCYVLYLFRVIVVSLTEGEFRVGLAPEAGVLIPVSFGSSLVLGARYDYAFNSGNALGGKFDVTFLSATIGMAYDFSY